MNLRSLTAALARLCADAVIASGMLVTLGAGCRAQSLPLDPLPAAAVRKQVPGGVVLRLQRLPGHTTWWVRDSDASDLTEPDLRAITTDSAWAVWWRSAAGMSRRPRPPVHFGRTTVLVAAMGVRPAGTRILVEGAALRRDTLFVLIRRDIGVPGACRTDGSVNAVAVAVVPVPASHAVVFRERRLDFGCRSPAD